MTSFSRSLCFLFSLVILNWFACLSCVAKDYHNYHNYEYRLLRLSALLRLLHLNILEKIACCFFFSSAACFFALAINAKMPLSSGNNRCAVSND